MKEACLLLVAPAPCCQPSSYWVKEHDRPHKNIIFVSKKYIYMFARNTLVCKKIYWVREYARAHKTVGIFGWILFWSSKEAGEHGKIAIPNECQISIFHCFKFHKMCLKYLSRLLFKWSADHY